MAHDVFISHSSLDKKAADAVCHGLEARGVRCWIAPRDQMAGRPYGEQITAAIQSARVMVLVFSDHVNKSQAVLNEINLAAGANVTIVPFRIEAVEFNPELHYYLGRTHWLDAFPHAVHSYVDALAATVSRNLEPADAISPPAAASAPVRASGTRRRRLLFGAVALGGLLLAALATVAMLSLRGPSGALPGPGVDTTPVKPANPQQVADFESVVVPSGPPLTLAGVTVVNTAQMTAKIRAHDAGQIHLWLIDARGCSTEPTLPTADCLVPNTIDQLKAEAPVRMEVIFFCLDGSCPESYQMAKAALAAGYADVLWYRGGVNAWAAAGLPTVSHTP